MSNSRLAISRGLSCTSIKHLGSLQLLKGMVIRYCSWRGKKKIPTPSPLTTIKINYGTKGTSTIHFEHRSSKCGSWVPDYVCRTSRRNHLRVPHHEDFGRSVWYCTID